MQSRSISYNELNYMITYAMLKELMEPDEFVTVLELLDKSAGHTNTAKRVARNIFVMARLLRLVELLINSIKITASALVGYIRVMNPKCKT